jgi:hypothetical protein
MASSSQKGFKKMSSPFPLRILVATLLGCSLAIAADTSRQEKEFIRRALATMQYVAPHVPVQAPFLQIHSDDCHGWWGNLFGDDQPAALIAVESRGNGKNNFWDNARLFLLLWKNGWQLTQQIGPVAAWQNDRWWNDDSFDISGGDQGWRLKVTAESHERYLLSDLSPNNAVDQRSWRLDPSAHDLKPTGWPRNASASISWKSITLLRRPHDQQMIETIHHFDGTIGAEIISIQTEYDSRNVSTVTLTVPAQKDRPAAAWLIRRESYNSIKKLYSYSVCHRSPSAAAATAFEENAVLEVSWGDQYAEDRSAARYLFHRLTGLDRAAYDAEWDQDQPKKLLLPQSVKVTGDPEAVKLFTLDSK